LLPSLLFSSLLFSSLLNTIPTRCRGKGCNLKQAAG
jgi:hypothetical protein